jgi:hypothetical protein
MSLFERFRAGSVRNVNVWASHRNFGRVLAEPTQFKRNVQYPEGDMHTQAGWHVTLVFNNLAELATQLERGVEVPDSFYPSDVVRRGAPPIRRGEISRLAIMVHGMQGGVAMVDGKENPNNLSVKTFESYRPILGRIGGFTKPMSTILIMGCLAGQGEPGTELLKLLSAVWPGRIVVGFRTIGYRHPGEMTKGAPNELPGMKDTKVEDPLFWNPAKELEQRTLWAKGELPWGSEYSPHAKLVRNGVVLKCPAGEVCK